MPYASDAQRRFFNANRKKLERQGVDVDEWNESSRGKKLPERKEPKEKAAAIAALQDMAGRVMDALPEDTGPLAAGGALAGGVGGGVLGALRDPGEDEEGNRKSRLMHVLKHGLGGAAAGAVGLPLGVAGGKQLGQNLSLGAMSKGLAGLFPKRAAVAALAVTAAKLAADKEAIDVEEGGPVSRVTASTLGRLNPLNLQLLLATRRAYSDPSRDLLLKKDEERLRRHEETAKLMEQYDPEALQNTLVRLGGTNIVDDLFYQKDRGRNLPWTKRIGGRVWHNPHTSIAGKAIGTVATPLQSLLTPLMRASNYNPYTDVASVYQNEDPFVEHEIGHALDFNKLYGMRTGGEGGGFRNFMKRQGKGALRDLYTAGYQRLPLLRLLHEARANIESQKALNAGLKDRPEELVARNIRRLEVLPATYVGYAGDALGPNFGSLMGTAIGKRIGMRAADTYRQYNKHTGPMRKKTEEQPEVKEAASDVVMLARASLKQARCWKGYEPVPGKPPYSEDSCRPVGSAPKAKKKEKKASSVSADSERRWKIKLEKLKARTTIADETTH